MLTKIELHNPVAIFDKELSGAKSFTVQSFELCTMCGARFGIGFYGGSGRNVRTTGEVQEELPKKLTEILAKDHRQDRPHRGFIDLDV